MINRGIINGERITENYTEIIDTSDNVGVILCGITVDSFLRIYNDSTLTDTGEIYLIDNRGLLLSSSDKSIDRDIKKGPVDIDYFIRDSKSSGNSIHWMEIDGINYLMNYHKDPEFGFYIYTLQPEKSILEDFKLFKNIIVVASTTRSIFLLIIAILVISYFTKPIEILTFYMTKFIDNRSDEMIESRIIHQLRSRIKNKNEIGVLSRTFETLLTTQKKLNDEIISREQSKATTEFRSKVYLSTILNSLPSMIVSLDDQFKITQWNSTAEFMCKQTAIAVTGRLVWDELPMLKRFHKDIENIMDNSLKDIHFEAKNVSWNNMFINISVSGLSSNISRGAIIRIDDVTEKVRIGELLIQSEKMLSVGGLAAGMAHEINNPLGGMMQNSSVINNRLIKNLSLPVNIKAATDAGTTIDSIRLYMEARNIPKLLDNIQESGKVIRSIINNMLSFSRKGGDITSTYHLETILDKSIDLSASDICKDIEIIKHIDEGLPVIQCDAVKIQQVLLNIIINGSQAMHSAKTENPSFNITIKLSDDEKHIITEIRDNGPGMTEDIRKRIFEPFYTTKPVGLGTGLGLSVSYFIIKENHRGELSVQSNPGSGANFIIKLPIIQVEY
jgi:PAS domain S-box-containing protein